MCENTVSYFVLEVRKKKEVAVLLFELMAATGFEAILADLTGFFMDF